MSSYELTYPMGSHQLTVHMISYEFKNTFSDNPT